MLSSFYRFAEGMKSTNLQISEKQSYFVEIFLHNSTLFASVNAEISCWNCQRNQNVTLSNFFVIRNVPELLNWYLYRNLFDLICADMKS